MIATVSVDVATQALNYDFDYLVPEELMELVGIGQRVEIPFNTRIISGVITGFKKTSEIKGLKKIRRILEFKGVFSHEMITLSEILATKYLRPKIEYLHTMLPNAMKMTYQKYLQIQDLELLDDELKPLFNQKKELKLNDALKPYYKKIHQAIELGIIEPFTRVVQRQKEAKEEYITLLKPDEKMRSIKQKEIIETLKNHDLIKLKTLTENLTITKAHLKPLITKNIVQILSYEKYRELEFYYPLKDRHIILNPEQEIAYQTVKENFNQAKTFLLHGITSSGKTEIYIKLTKAIKELGKSVLILVPEISLTPQLTARFKACFNEDVAVYHSRLTMGEQYDEWRRVKNNQAHIVIGARSAIFSPLKNIGLIILDEEHSTSYIQEESPNYDAKEIALLRSKEHQAPLILGSATPSIDSYFHAENNHYTLLTLKKRALESVLPDIKLIDMKKEFLIGNTSILSTSLKKAIQNRLDKNEQSLVLINRRGHANFVLCRVCGKTVMCDACDISYTYHQTTHKLKCHYCNTQKDMVETCPNCGSNHIRYMGIGSEKVTSYLQSIFPTATIQRMDKDTTQQKHAHEKILTEFEINGDILVGTQMISKGLDFEKVSLVAILSADLSLYIPSYYAKEEAYALFTQMAGRSGRRQIKGEVIIQAYNPEHPVLYDVLNQDYQAFYDREIKLREIASVSPYKQMVLCTITHSKLNQAALKATELSRTLKKILSKDAKVIGPIKPHIQKLNNRYRSEVLIKHQEEPKLIKTLSTFLKNLNTNEYTFTINHSPRIF